MQYISERFKGNVDIEVIDCSDMFATLQDSINKIEVVQETNRTTSICLDVISSDGVNISDYKNSTYEDFSKAYDLMNRLYEYIDNLDVEPSEIDLRLVPSEFKKFFSVKRSIDFYNTLKYSKKITRRGSRLVKKSNARLKKRMFF